MAQFLLNALTLSNINLFSKFFHSQNHEKICNNIITKDPTNPQVCRNTTLWNVRTQKVMVSVGMSRMGKTGIVFVEPGAKVSIEYYCQHVFGGGLLWHPCKMPALLLDPAAGRRTVTHCYRIRNTLTYTCGVRMSRLSSLTCSPPNSPDLNPVDYAVWVPFSIQKFN